MMSHWGWGYDGQRFEGEELAATAAGVVEHLGFGSTELEEPVALDALELPPPRIEVPPQLASIASQSAYDRARYAHGRSYSDIVNGFRGRFPHPPDMVLRPTLEAEIEAVLEWASSAGVAVTPWGGGTSVVGGVDPIPGAGHNGAVTLALEHFNRVLRLDHVANSARIQAGAAGPVLEAQLANHERTLRFFPQSFELATLGGWIATRAGGHFATGPTHIDDLVESVRALTPSGEWKSLRLPGSGAGPSPDRWLLGSEGTLGVIVDAWVRILPKPAVRRSASVRFPRGFAAGAEAVRAILQDGLRPANCRLLDADEARITLAGDGTHALLVLGFEDAIDARVADAGMARALELCAEAGGESDGVAEGGRSGAAGAWRDAFLRAPYLRDVMIAAGILSDTFETSITWERLPGFVETVLGAAREALHEASGGKGVVSVRLTHAYPDGAAPYFTCLAPARRGDEVAQWSEVKRIASDAVAAAGGTITHHHAVGRDHRPWYDAQRPEPFAAGFKAAKAALDPAGVLNPGVLID